MAYVSKETKAKLSPAIKAVLKKYKMKGTIAVRHHTMLVVNIKEGELDILGAMKNAALKSAHWDHSNVHDVENLNYTLSATHTNVNEYWIDKNYACPVVVAFLTELKEAMYGEDYFDKTDIMSDYFHCSHYINIKVGQYDKPYVCTGEVQEFAPLEVEGAVA